MCTQRSQIMVLVAFCVIGLTVAQTMDTSTTASSTNQEESNVTGQEMFADIKLRTFI